MDRDAALELLRAGHSFPGPFEFRVVVPPDKVDETVEAMVARAGEAAELRDVARRTSSKGRWVALHVRIHLGDAERVLDIYDVVRSMTHVVASM